jgi:hypothetical protein
MTLLNSLGLPTQAAAGVLLVTISVKLADQALLSFAI